jgi:hypothetical protein
MSGSRFNHSLMLIALLALIAAPALASDATPAAAPGYALYATVDDGRVLARLDPSTLADVPGSRHDLARQYVDVVASADGSTSVVIDGRQGPLEGWIRVYNGVLDAERRAIDVSEPVFNPLLSADGSRVVARTQWTCGPSGCDPVAWYAWDTRAGAQVSVTQVDLASYAGVPMLSPDGSRLYVPYYEAPPPASPATPTPVGISATGPWPLRIAAYDIDTGGELARGGVPGVLAGSWPIDSELDSYAMEGLFPAIALSPDGRTIAVVDAGMTELTVLDAVTLDVVTTRAIREPAGLTRRALAWLGILPQDAAAKAIDGAWRSVTFAPDGASLYVTGYELDTSEAAREVTGHGFGVSRIDVATGEIVATGLDGAEVQQVVPSPDGATLYVMRSETPWWEPGGGSAQLLVRLDVATLEPLAERPIGEWSRIFIVPARS